MYGVHTKRMQECHCYFIKIRQIQSNIGDTMSLGSQFTYRTIEIIQQ